MKKILYVLIGLAVLSCLVSAAAASDSVGGDRGFVQVACNVEGASATLVDINNQVVGTQIISSGQCEFAVYTTGTPISRVIVSKEGYFTNGAEITMPSPGKTVFVTVNLDSMASGPIGGDRGIIRIEGTGVIGAKVELISISGDVAGTGYTDIYGNAELPVYTTGTPINEVRVSAPGWMTVSRNDLQMPGSGQTKSYTVPLTPLNPTTVPTAPVTSPLGLSIAGLIVGLGAAALLRRN